MIYALQNMERLTEDAHHVQALLPWIDSIEDIITFMRKIPLDKSHLRLQLTLHYFLSHRDMYNEAFDKQIEVDAKEIVIVLPDQFYKEIRDRLVVLGNMPNRKEVVLRQLLHEREGLDAIVKEIENTNKRKLEDLCGLNSSTDEMKIKILKRDGEFKVIPSSSTSISSSTSHSEPISPDSTIPSTSNETTYSVTAFNQETENTNQLSASVIALPWTKESPVKSAMPLHNVNDRASASIANEEVIRVSESPNNTSVIKSTTDHTLNNNNKMEHESKFDLINFLKDMTLASEKKILRLCKMQKLDLDKRPSDAKLTYLINELLEDVVEVNSDYSSTYDSDSDTQEYSLPDGYVQHLPKKSQFSKDKFKSSKANSDLNTKDFKLKEPTLTLDTKPMPKEDLNPTILENPTILPTRARPIVQPARLNLPKNLTEEEAFPAMPQEFLDRIDKITNELRELDRQHQGNLRPVEVPTVINAKASNNGEPSRNHLSEAGTSGSSNNKKIVVDEKLVLKLIEMFPEACPAYIRNICDGKQWSEFDDVITVILSNPSYPKRPQRVSSPVKELDVEEQYEILKELLPDADPTYLRMQCERYANDDKGLKQFINQAMENKDYPSMKEYLRKQQLSAQQKQYTTEFKIENFIQLFPEPEKTFNDPNRNIKVDSYSMHYLNLFFRNKFDKLSARTIQQMLCQKDYKIIKSNAVFEEMIINKHVMKSRRKPVPLPDNMQNIPMLQELAYLSHKEEIENYLSEKAKKEKEERLLSKEAGLLETCGCCYDDEVMPKDTFSCPNECKFCKDCIKKSCEVALGEGKTNFSCLASCTAEFTLQTLQHVLPPKMFSKLAQKKALAEIKAAGIEELEMCPFCDFATIPNEADKIFRCLNPDCMKESCRLCKEPNHVPLKCEEVEKDQDIKARTYVENKMTEALIRKCWKCGTSFFKEEGCNKMTCSCGAQMCYICKQPVRDYSHFNGIGGDKFNLCPLYSDTNLINQQNVMGAAAAAKAEVGTNLKIDPTSDIQVHYENRKKKLPVEPHLELIHGNHHVHHHRHHHPHYNYHVVNHRLPPPPPPHDAQWRAQVRADLDQFAAVAAANAAAVFRRQQQRTIAQNRTERYRVDKRVDKR